MRFSIVSAEVDLKCNRDDVIVSSINLDCEASRFTLVNEERPFRVINHIESDSVLIVVDGGSISGLRLPNFESFRGSGLLVLVVLNSGGSVDVDNWAVDAIILQESPSETSEKVHYCSQSVCAYDTQLLGKQVSMNFQLEEEKFQRFSNDFDIFYKSGSTIKFCIVRTDCESVWFDSHIEWLFNTLSEKPCRSSDFVIVLLDGPKEMGDDIIMNRLITNSLVDLVLRRIELDNLNFQVTRGAGVGLEISFIQAKKIISNVVSKLNDRISLEPSYIAGHSDLLDVDVCYSIFVAVLSGLAINTALKRSFSKRNY